MPIAKSAACQTFTASRRDNGTLIVVEKIELHCTVETGRGRKLDFYAFLAIVVIFQNYWEKKVYSKTASCVIDLHARFTYLASVQ